MGPEPLAFKPLFSPGDTVGSYQVLRLLGKGGMGEVYLALDLQLGRKVALKIIHSLRMRSTQARRRFLQEARLTARFNHPHIITLYAAGEHNQHPYLALEYLEGENLRERLERETLSWQESLRIMLPVAEALQEAHKHNIHHRDLKPENIFLPKDGRVRVLDFGLAKQQSTHPDGKSKQEAAQLWEKTTSWIEQMDTAQEDEATQTFNPSLLEELVPALPETSAGPGLHGTPAYMSPEQWSKQPSTPATDVWAWGVVLFELLTQRRPFGGSNRLDLASDIYFGKPSLVEHTSLPRSLVALVERCLKKLPEERIPLGVLCQELRALLASPNPKEEQQPFRGLSPFSERHAAYFYGREQEVELFLERLREVPILPVVGASGAGKSSFLQAGVFPRLREQGRWTILSMRPGSHPFEVLGTKLVTQTSHSESASLSSWSRVSQPGEHKAQESNAPQEHTPHIEELAGQLLETPSLLALWLRRYAEEGRAKGRDKVLLFLDQFEEIFTLVEDQKRRQSFLRAICAAANDADDPVRVVFTLRDDFLGRLAQLPESREALRQVMLLSTPDEAALHRMLCAPVHALDYQYDPPELPTTIIEALRHERACLPLLQFTARMLWDRRNTKTQRLVKKAYQQMGGVEGALANHADGVLHRLSAEQVEWSKALFLRMITPENTRKVVSRSALLRGLPEGAEGVLEALVQARLLSVRKNTYQPAAGAQFELVHESLLTTWRQLGQWLEESREERIFLTELEQAAALWQKRGRREEEVWRGDALADALRARKRLHQPIAPLLEAFLQAGITLEQRTTYRKRLVERTLMGLAFLLFLAISVGLWQVNKQRKRAERQKRNALSQKAEALHQRKRARARLATALIQGALRSYQSKDLLAARSKLRSSLELQDTSTARFLWQKLRRLSLRWQASYSGAIYQAVYSPSGTIAMANQNKMVYLIDSKTLSTQIRAIACVCLIKSALTSLEN